MITLNKASQQYQVLLKLPSYSEGVGTTSNDFFQEHCQDSNDPNLYMTRKRLGSVFSELKSLGLIKENGKRLSVKTRRLDFVLEALRPKFHELRGNIAHIRI